MPARRASVFSASSLISDLIRQRLKSPEADRPGPPRRRLAATQKAGAREETASRRLKARDCKQLSATSCRPFASVPGPRPSRVAGPRARGHFAAAARPLRGEWPEADDKAAFARRHFHAAGWALNAQMYRVHSDRAGGRQAPDRRTG